MPVFFRETVGLIGKDTEIAVAALKSSNPIYQIFVYYSMGVPNSEVAYESHKIQSEAPSGTIHPRIGNEKETPDSASCPTTLQVAGSIRVRLWLDPALPQNII